MGERVVGADAEEKQRLESALKEAGELRDYKWRAKVDEELKCLIIRLKSSVHLFFLPSLNNFKEDLQVEDARMLTLFRLDLRRVMLLGFSASTLLYKEVGVKTAAGCTTLSFLHSGETVLLVQHYNSRNEMAKMVIGTSTARCFHLTFKISADNNLAYSVQEFGESQGFLARVSGLFSKAPLYSPYQDQPRAISVSSKHDPLFKETKKLVVVCVSDIHIRTWKIDPKNDHVEFLEKATLQSQIAGMVETQAGQKLFNFSVLDAKLQGARRLVILAKVVRGEMSRAETQEDLIISEWNFEATSSKAGPGKLAIGRGLALDSQTITDFELIRMSHLHPIQDRGFVAIDKADHSHLLHYYELGGACCAKKIEVPIFGCNQHALEEVPPSLITPAGILYVRQEGAGHDIEVFTMEEAEYGGIGSSSKVRTKTPVKPESVGSQNAQMMEVGQKESFERLLHEYERRRGGRGVIDNIRRLLIASGESQARSWISRVVQNALHKQRGLDAPPIMKREEMERDIDKGLIVYQLKYVQNHMAALVEVLMECRLVDGSEMPSIQSAVWEAVEGYERAVVAAELRRLQNEFIVKSRKSEKQMEAEESYVAGMFGRTIAEGVEEVLRKRGVTREVLEKEGVTASDMFYAQLDSVEDIFMGLARFFEINFAHKNDSHMFRVLEINNLVCICAFEAVRECRKEGMYTRLRGGRGIIWTAKWDLLEVVVHRHIMPTLSAIDQLPCHNRDTLLKQAFELMNLVLGEMQDQIVAQNLGAYDEYYAKFREVKQLMLDRSSSQDPALTLDLAIKYKDYDKVVEMCEMRGDYGRLHGLVQEWRDANFLENAFDWYVRSYFNALPHDRPGRRLKLFEVFEQSYSRELEVYLTRKHPGLLWLYYLKRGKHDIAGMLLRQHAEAADHFSALQKILKVGRLNNIVAAQGENLQYLECVEAGHKLLRDEGQVKHNKVLQLEELMSELTNFGDSPKFLERVELAYNLVAMSPSETKREFVMRLFRCVLEKERDVLKGIQRDKLEFTKSDTELEEEVSKTGLYRLCILERELGPLCDASELISEFEEVRHAIETALAQSLSMVN